MKIFWHTVSMKNIYLYLGLFILAVSCSQDSNLETNLQQIKQTQDLDFSIEFLWEDPPSYAVLKANEKIHIHLSKLDKALTLPIRPVLYIFSNEVDKLYSSFLDRGVNIHQPSGDRDYQMRDFDIVDPDGHLLTFGRNL